MATMIIITTAVAVVIRVELGAPAADDVAVVVMLEGEYAAKYGPFAMLDGFQKKPATLDVNAIMAVFLLDLTFTSSQRAKRT
jgi:hypothetical protein